jgi:long-chain fatty acid transport protein
MAFSKKSCAAVVTAAVTMISSAVFAGSIDYVSNQSADYIRTFSRNAAMDSADIAIYNPAGTAFYRPGLSLQYSHQTVLKNYGAKLTDSGDSDLGIADNPSYDRDYRSKKATPVLPSAFAIYNKDKWAGYIAASAVAGGGSVSYDNAVPMIVTMYNTVAKMVYEKTLAAGQTPAYSAAYAKGAANTLLGGTYVNGTGKFAGLSFYPQFTLGGSYAVNDMFSVSAAGRLVIGIKQYDAKATFYNSSTGTYRTIKLDADENAVGFGGVFGAMFRPLKELVFTARYETQTVLDWKTTINDNKAFTLTNGSVLLFKDGATRRKDLPAMLALGTSYTFFDRVTVYGSYDLFFIGQADQQKDDESKGLYNDGYDDHYDKYGWEASIAAEVVIVPKFLKLSAGYMHTKVGGNKYTFDEFNMCLDSNTLCGGGRVSVLDNLDLSFGYSHTKYISKKNVDGIEYHKIAQVLALSAETKL